MREGGGRPGEEVALGEGVEVDNQVAFTRGEVEAVELDSVLRGVGANEKADTRIGVEGPDVAHQTGVMLGLVEVLSAEVGFVIAVTNVDADEEVNVFAGFCDMHLGAGEELGSGGEIGADGVGVLDDGLGVAIGPTVAEQKSSPFCPAKKLGRVEVILLIEASGDGTEEWSVQMKLKECSGDPYRGLVDPLGEAPKPWRPKPARRIAAKSIVTGGGEMLGIVLEGEVGDGEVMLAGGGDEVREGP